MTPEKPTNTKKLVTPEDVVPFPICVRRKVKQRRRKAKKSKIMTSIPMKNIKEQKQRLKLRRKPKKKKLITRRKLALHESKVPKHGCRKRKKSPALNKNKKDKVRQNVEKPLHSQNDEESSSVAMQEKNDAMFLKILKNYFILKIKDLKNCLLLKTESHLLPKIKSHLLTEIKSRLRKKNIIHAWYVAPQYPDQRSSGYNVTHGKNGAIKPALITADVRFVL